MAARKRLRSKDRLVLLAAHALPTSHPSQLRPLQHPSQWLLQPQPLGDLARKGRHATHRCAKLMPWTSARRQCCCGSRGRHPPKRHESGAMIWSARWARAEATRLPHLAHAAAPARTAAAGSDLPVAGAAGGAGAAAGAREAAHLLRVPQTARAPSLDVKPRHGPPGFVVPVIGTVTWIQRGQAIALPLKPGWRWC